MPNPSIESRNYIRYFFMNIKKPVGQPAGSTGHAAGHGLRTPNEGINQSYLKNWAEVADKICFGRT